VFFRQERVRVGAAQGQGERQLRKKSARQDAGESSLIRFLQDLATPLTLAAQEGHLEIAEALIGAKAEVNAQNDVCDPCFLHLKNLLQKGNTALNLCCKKGHSQVAKVLIGAGAGVNLPDNVADS